MTRKERCRVEEAQHFVLTSGSQLEVKGSLTNPLTDWEIEPRERGDVSGRRREGGREGEKEGGRKEGEGGGGRKVKEEKSREKGEVEWGERVEGGKGTEERKK